MGWPASWRARAAQGERTFPKGKIHDGAVTVAVAVAVAALAAAAVAVAIASVAGAAIAPGAREVPVRRQPPVLRRQWLVLPVLYITPLGLSSVQGYVRGRASGQTVDQPVVAASVADADATATIATAAAIVAAPGGGKVPVQRRPPVLPRQWLVLPVLYFAPLG